MLTTELAHLEADLQKVLSTPSGAWPKDADLTQDQAEQILRAQIQEICARESTLPLEKGGAYEQ